MLKVKILKSGKFSLDAASGGTVGFKKGDEYTEDDKLLDVNGKERNASGDLNCMSEVVARRMEKAGWASITVEDEPKDEPELEKGPVSELNDILKDIPDEKKQKTKIQDWAMINYGIKPSKAKSAVNMVMEIEDHIANEADPE